MKGVMGRVLVPGISGGLAALTVFGILQVAGATPSAPVSAAAAAATEQRSPAEPVVDPFADLEAAPTPSTTPAIDATAAPRAKTPAPRAVDPGRLARTGKGGQFVSLTAHGRQVIRPGRWTPLRFDGEQSDRLGWHSPGASLVVPNRTGVALVCYKVTWADDGDPGQYYAQIARDPGGRVDVTGAEDAVNNPGKDYRALCWTMTVRKGQPLAIRVKHDGQGPTVAEFAEFKVWIP